jgi:hypothetical protein
MKRIFGWKPLSRCKCRGAFADGLVGNLAFSANSRKPKYFRPPVREWAQSRLVLMHEGPDEFDFT